MDRVITTAPCNPAYELISSHLAMSNIGDFKINLSDVIDQTMAGTAPMLPVSKINELHKGYEDRLEGECPEGEAPSDQQLSCLLYVVLMKLLNPFCRPRRLGPHTT